MGSLVQSRFPTAVRSARRCADAGLALGPLASSPQWTDLNEPDPGISILELFASPAAAYLFMTSLGSILMRTGLVRRTVTVVADGEPWTQRETLEDAGPDARVFRVDSATGSIQFGDGAQGRVASGSVIITSSYRYGRCRLNGLGTGILRSRRCSWRDRGE
jgi:hypothetical protein